jgi:hypothetical protein
MLVDFEVLNNVLIDLKPLARLLDSHSGHKGHYREKIHLCSIWLKTVMLADFKVLNNVLMDLKPLARLLDPHSGHKGHDREKSTSVRFG